MNNDMFDKKRGFFDNYKIKKEIIEKTKIEYKADTVYTKTNSFIERIVSIMIQDLDDKVAHGEFISNYTIPRKNFDMIENNYPSLSGIGFGWKKSFKNDLKEEFMKYGISQEEANNALMILYSAAECTITFNTCVLNKESNVGPVTN